jgi:hypothetical protein
MLFAVAGMNAEKVNATTKRLAGDWSDFPADERAGLLYARKQARAPWSITDDDIKELERQCGKDKAWQIVWYAARCHYMTTVADSFQLPLEKENPFYAMPGAKKAK